MAEKLSDVAVMELAGNLLCRVLGKGFFSTEGISLEILFYKTTQGVVRGSWWVLVTTDQCAL